MTTSLLPPVWYSSLKGRVLEPLAHPGAHKKLGYLNSLTLIDHCMANIAEMLLVLNTNPQLISAEHAVS